METNTANEKRTVFLLTYTTQQNDRFIHGVLDVYATKLSATSAMYRIGSELKDLGFTYSPCKKQNRVIMTREIDGQVTNLFIEEKPLI